MCKEILDGQMCSYGNNCTFAQSDEERLVWNAERSGKFARHWILGHLNGFDSTYFLKGIVNRYGGGFLFKNTSNDPSGRPKRNLFHEKIVRIRDPRGCKMEICWHQSNGRICKVGETCHFAHSQIELELWLLLTSTKLSAQQLVHFTETGSISVKRKINQVNHRDMDIPPINLLVQSASLLCSKAFILFFT